MGIVLNIEYNKIYCGDALDVLKGFQNESVNCCVTSPPYYGLRDYGISGQIGRENTPEEYVQRLTDIFSEVKRVLKKDGTLWLVIGDSYAGSNQAAGAKELNSVQRSNKGCLYMPKQKRSLLSKLPGYKPKDMIGIPWMTAFALRENGWYLRQDIIWAKGNPMPEQKRDRCTKSHEYVFLFSKSRKYYFDCDAIREPASGMPGRYNRDGKRNRRDVWFVNMKKTKSAHFATYPEALIEPCILAGCPKEGIVLDPFMGSGTTAVVAVRYNRNYVGIELNPEYIEIAVNRIEENKAR